jgi:ABC-type sugar transport system, permease component
MGISIFKVIREIVIWISVFLLIAWIIIPAYWTIKTAFSRPEDAWNWVPSMLTLQNLISLVAPTVEEYFRGHGIRAALPIPISQAIRNSFIVSLTSSLISVALGFLAGYSLARFQYRFKSSIEGLIVFSYTFPVFIIVIPLLMIYRILGLYNTLLGLAIAHLAYTVPVSTLLIRSYMLNMPKELEDAALVDGATRMQVLIRIVLPLSLPAIATAFIFAFTLSWGDLLFSIILISSPEIYTVPIAIQFFLWGGEIVDPGGLAALTLFVGIVPVILYGFMQRYIIQGLLRGALKYG